MDVGEYKYNYEGFYKKIYIPNAYKEGENDYNSKCPCKPSEDFQISSFSLLVKSFEEEIKPSSNLVDTT